MNKIAVAAIGVTVGVIAGIYANHIATKKHVENSKEFWIAEGETLGRDEALRDDAAVTEAYNRLHPKTSSKTK